MNSVDIVFDIGGTKTRVAASDEGTALRDVHIFNTPLDPDDGVAKLTNAIRTIVGDFTVHAICGGAKGTIQDGIIHKPPHITQWDGVDLGGILKREFSTEVTLFNDTALVALGEYYYGAGIGESNMLYVTVSTGVGGHLVVNGKIQKGKYNSEIGHQMVREGELEDLISGPSVEKKYGVHPKDLDDIEKRNKLADILAEGLHDNVLHWSPEVIVIGGSMIVGKNPIPLERVEETLTKLVKEHYPTSPRILKAKLKDEGGLYGGMGYLTRSI